MSYPFSIKWVAKLWRKVWIDACLCIFALFRAVWKAFCRVLGYIWNRLTMFVLGSIDNLKDGNTQNQSHSFPALGYFLSRAKGNSTPLRFSFRSFSYNILISVMCFDKDCLRCRGRMVCRSLSPLADRMVIHIAVESISLILKALDFFQAYSRSIFDLLGHLSPVELPTFD